MGPAGGRARRTDGAVVRHPQPVDGLRRRGAARRRRHAERGSLATSYDWTVGESPDGLRIDHGLLDRAHETVPPGRVQAVRIVEPLLWRRRGWVHVRLDVAGSSNSVLVPVARARPRGGDRTGAAGVTVPSSLSRPPRRRAGASRSGGAATDWPLRTRSSPPGAACCAAVFPWSPMRRCRAYGSRGALGAASEVADIHVDTGANKTVTARLRDAEEAQAVLYAQADRSRTGRATPGRTGGWPPRRRRGRRRAAAHRVPPPFAGTICLRTPRCAAPGRRSAPSRHGRSGR